ncbi:MAG: ArsR family transcriptional regulator [Candidatus Hodarchaeales archaeon]|jgi:predicted transcriptional regulator
MDNYESLVMELSNPIHTQLLEELLDSPKKLNDIAQKFTLSKSEISRHLSRLLDTGTITKDNKNRNYVLNPLGAVFLNLISPIKFLLQHASYFKTHFINFPTKFLRLIDDLSDAKFISGPGDVLSLIQSILDKTESKVQLILDQKYPLKLSKKIEIGKYVVSPEMLGKGEQYLKQFYDTVETRVYQPINHNLFISDDREATLCFSDLNHKTDINSCFHIKDKAGLEFLQQIWSYYWSLGA